MGVIQLWRIFLGSIIDVSFTDGAIIKGNFNLGYMQTNT